MQKVAASVEMSGDIAMSPVGERSNRSSRTGHRMMRENDRFSFGGPDGMDASVALSTSSSFYGGGVTITGGPPDETFKDEYGNECTRYTNRTIIVNEHMANAAETRNHNGIDINAPSAFGASIRNRAIAFLFVATTVVLLLVVFLDLGSGDPSYGGSKEDKLAAALGYDTVDDWDDDDDNFSTYTHSALGDD